MLTLYCALLLTGALRNAIEIGVYLRRFRDIELKYFVQVHLTILSIASCAAFAENGRKGRFLNFIQLR